MSVPAWVGRYEIGRALGRGGQGAVYEAVLHGPGGLRKPVALKVLAQGGETLRREARLGGLLRHPHLVDVYEVGEHDGTWFCAMELCRGGTLALHVPLSPRAIVEAGLQVCEALAYAHAALGLVHLDLKPANLLLDGGRVKVADLGIARADGFERVAFVGTPGYMAPEQGRGGRVDARADVWALGVTLCELATGTLPSKSSATLSVDDGSTLAWADDAPEPRPSAIPDWLAPAVSRCLELDPRDRYASMAELAAALRALPVSGPPLAALGGGGSEPAAWSAEASSDLIGRDAEISALSERLARPGALVLVKGPPGIGKSRLAAAAARGWPGPTRVSSLGEADPALLTTVLAAAFDVSASAASGSAAVDLLGAAIGRLGDALVVLDDADAVAADLAALLARWRALAPRARWLVTSREPLRAGEEVLELGPLDPADARALLAARARERGVELGSDPAADALARRLDGIPLALELAAGRVGVLSVAEVLDRLDLSLLRSGSGGRQSTLAAALDWSFEALAPDELRALGYLSVLRGGFDFGAAEAVLPDGAEGHLERLIERSLVVVRGGRLAILLPVQEYAASKLGRADLAEAVARHARHFAALGRREELWRVEASARATRDFENLVAAARGAVASGDPESALAAAIAASSVYEVRGPVSAGAELLAEVRAACPTGSRAWEAAWMEGVLRRIGGDPAGASRCFREALHLLDGRPDPFGLARVNGSLGILLQSTGRLAEAGEHYERSLAAARIAQDRPYEGVACANLGNYHREAMHLDEAERCFLAALAIHREVGNRRSEGVSLGHLANLAHHRGRVAESLAFAEQALAVHREVGNRKFEAAVLSTMGALLVELGRPEEALARCAEAGALAREVGDRRAAGIVTSRMGAIALDQGRPDEARPWFEEALAIHREISNRQWIGTTLGQLARVALEEGRDAEAERHATEALAVLRALSRPGECAAPLVSLAEVARRAGDVALAEARLAEAEPLIGSGSELWAGPWLHLVRARAALDRGDAATASAAVRRARDLAQGTNPTGFVARLLSDVSAAAGRASPRVRLATPDDAVAMAEAHVHGWRAAYRGIVPDAHLDGLSVDQRAAMWTRLLSGPADQRRHWVIETDRVQGFAGTGPTRDDDDDPQRVSELMVIYLRPEVVGTGLGRALLEHAVADVRSRGWAGVSLWVFEGNARGRRFYERAGFVPDGTRKSFELGGATLWELRYRLSLRPST